MKLFSFIAVIVALAAGFFITTSCGTEKNVTEDEKKNYNLVDGGVVPVDKKADVAEEKFFDGLKAKAIGDYQKALNSFKDAVKADPKMDAAHYEVARLLQSSGNEEEALVYANNAADLDPSNRWYMALYALLLSENESFSEAANVFQTILTSFPDEYDYYFEWAFALLQNDQPIKAIDVYNKLEERIGVTEEVIIQKQQIYLGLGEFEKAVEETRKLINAFPQEPRYYGMVAELFQANNQLDEAIEVYLKLLEKDPENPYALLALADIYYIRGEHDPYLDYLKRGFASNKMDIKLKLPYMLPFLNGSVSDEAAKQEAYKLIEILIATHPESADAYTVKGDMLSGEKKEIEALTEYKKALKLDENLFEVWRQVLLIESQKDMSDSLLKNSGEVIELFPNHPLAYLFNGMANSWMKKYPEAEKVLKQGVPVSYSNTELLVEFYLQLGDVYHYMKKHEQSDSCYELALKINPDNAYVLNNYAYYLSLRKEKLEKAKEMSLRSNQLIPNDANLLDTYAWILYQLGDFDGAKQWQEKALAADMKASAVILEHYGDILFQLGQTDEAINYWKQALEKGSEDDEKLSKKIADRKLYE